MKKHLPEVSVIMVSYNTQDDTLRAIHSVLTTGDWTKIEVVVVDNGSTDGSVESIRKNFPQVTILPQKKNLGFARANNLGAKVAAGEYLFFLNPDTVLENNAVAILQGELKKDPALGAISGQLINVDGTIQPQGGAIPNLKNICLWMAFIDDLPFVSSVLLPYQQRNSAFYKTKRETGWIGGTAMMLRKNVFNAIGGWDERFFMYGEDVELCMRLRKQGYKVAIQPDAKIRHLQHRSSGSAQRARIGELVGLVMIWRKHYAAWQRPILQAMLVMGSWLRLVLFGILRGNADDTATYLQASRRVFMA